jgi:[protein-PII] uridylyltransferase
MGTRERRSRSDEFDLLISSLYAKVTLSHRDIAIAAVGSFGRGELAPGSDLDIVIVHSPSVNQEAVSEAVNTILYPLWDKKIKVDHSVRTLAEARVAIHEDLKVVMGLLDARYICGNSELVADPVGDCEISQRCGR